MDERRGADRAEGPQDNQAAMTMGHSEAAWDAFYDKNYQRRECQAGVDAMNVWRQHMLTRAAEPRLAAPAANDGALVVYGMNDLHMSASDEE